MTWTLVIWTGLLVLVVLACLAFVALPLLRPRETWETPDVESELDRLLAEKQRVLRTLKDVESEHLAGLMNDDDHSAARSEYMDRAVELNREIADLTGVDPSRMGTEVEA